jgi:hypothetical protein
MTVLHLPAGIFFEITANFPSVSGNVIPILRSMPGPHSTHHTTTERRTAPAKDRRHGSASVRESIPKLLRGKPHHHKVTLPSNSPLHVVTMARCESRRCDGPIVLFETLRKETHR